jgi:hypothetical protein
MKSAFRFVKRWRGRGMSLTERGSHLVATNQSLDPSAVSVVVDLMIATKY